MPITRKPKSIDDFINAAGSEVAEKRNDQDIIASVKMRISQKLLRQIDDLVAKRKPSPSRHQWILEAIYEKLEKEM